MSINLDDAILHENDYYIHLHKMDVGNRRGNATINFSKQRQTVSMQTIAQYKELFNFNLKGQEIKTLAAAMDLDENEFLNTFNKKLSEKLQNDININALSSLYQTVKKRDISSHLKEAINKNSVQQLSLALEAVAKALKILENGNESLGAVLLNAVKGSDSFLAVGVRLENMLDRYKINNNYKTIKRQSLESAKKQLSNLAQALKSGNFVSTKNQITAEGLSTLLLNGIISTSIAQGLGFASRAKAQSIFAGVLLQAVGTKNVTVQSDIDKNVKITGKTDIKAKNVSISLEAKDSGNGGEIKLDIGISSKFYTGQGFKDLNKQSISIGSGSGGTLKQALDAVFSDDISRYLSYNYIVHDLYTQELNDLIAKRQILRLFATAGSSQDFSGFMLINGHVVSIWNIVQYALNTNLGLSHSMGGDKQQGIVLSIPDRPKIHKANNLDPVSGKDDNPSISAWQRSHAVNTALSSARIYAELHLKKLAMGYQE